MGRTSALILAATAAAVLGASASAHAADLLPPPPLPEPPPQAPIDFGGWYLRGDVGVGATQLTDWQYSLRPAADGTLPNGPVWNVNRSIGDTAFVGAGVGYQFNNWLRFDVTGEYRIDTTYRATQAYIFNTAGGPVFGADGYNANLGTALFLANAYLDLGTWYGITPFVGGGVGVAVHNLRGLTDYGIGAAGVGVARDYSTGNFAWAVTGGLGYAVTPNLRLETSYRYVDMGKVVSNPIACSAAPCFGERHGFNVASHDVRLGFRYLLGGAGPAPALLPPMPGPGPLIRKY